MPCGSWGMTNWEQQCYYHTVAPLKSSVAPRCVVVVVFQPVTHVSAMTLCDPMDCNTPGFPVLHCLLEFAQIHVHWVGDTIQPFHPLSSSSFPVFNLSQHQDLFQWVSSSHQVAKVSVSASASVLPMKIQNWFPLGWTGWISLQSKGLSRVFSNTTIQKYQLSGSQLSLWSNYHTHTWMTTGKTIALTR